MKEFLFVVESKPYLNLSKRKMCSMYSEANY